ncbi:hypothetical protein GCM10017744_080320 [Streptomyces antimycoticus]|uniref:Uncharacterized protein n=1 Tax=Streptomyces antimycoticus TaxID=68175 RepID=A0A4D4K3L7_9ACTN|nr:hypothetical protein SANT12839_021000 [Streptomyces antimycoticus]
MLSAYAFISHHRGRTGSTELPGLLHRSEHIGPAQQQLTELFTGLPADAAADGEVTSRPTSWRPRRTARTPSPSLPTCPPRPLSTGSLRSPWPGCVPLSDGCAVVRAGRVVLRSEPDKTPQRPAASASARVRA